MWLMSELKDSKEFLEHNLNIKVTSFAYPFGIFDDVVTQTAQQIGYETLVTVNNQKGYPARQNGAIHHSRRERREL